MNVMKEREPQAELITLKVPGGFWRDHVDRAPASEDGGGMAREVRWAGRQVEIRGTPEQIEHLRRDAEYYANPDNLDADRWLTESARRTVAAITKALGH